MIEATCPGARELINQVLDIEPAHKGAIAFKEETEPKYQAYLQEKENEGTSAARRTDSTEAHERTTDN